jgi:hypothetical protein
MTDFRQHVNRILSHSTDKFGEEVTFYPKSGGVYKVRGIFDNEYQTLDPDTEQVLSVNQPALGVNLNDIKFPLKQGDEVQVRETRFRVQDKREDGQGGAMLMLHKVTLNERLSDTKAR